MRNSREMTAPVKDLDPSVIEAAVQAAGHDAVSLAMILRSEACLDTLEQTGVTTAACGLDAPAYLRRAAKTRGEGAGLNNGIELSLQFNT